MNSSSQSGCLPEGRTNLSSISSIFETISIVFSVREWQCGALLGPMDRGEAHRTSETAIFGGYRA